MSICLFTSQVSQSLVYSPYNEIKRSYVRSTVDRSMTSKNLFFRLQFKHLPIAFKLWTNNLANQAFIRITASHGLIASLIEAYLIDILVVRALQDMNGANLSIRIKHELLINDISRSDHWWLSTIAHRQLDRPNRATDVVVDLCKLAINQVVKSLKSQLLWRWPLKQIALNRRAASL